MAETLDQKAKKERAIHVAKIIRHGSQIILPDGMSTNQAIEILFARAEYEKELVNLMYTFDAFVLDGAHAMAKVLESRYGWVQGKTEFGFFGNEPPKLIGVNVSRTEKVQVPWGKFAVPTIKGHFYTELEQKSGRMVFRLRAECLRVHEKEIEEVAELVKQYLATNSIYKGKAISIRFTDPITGNPIPMPTPDFLELDSLDVSQLILSKSVEEAVVTSLFTPIDKLQQARRLNVPIKRGVLMEGTFGVGKTLIGYVAAKKATAAKMTAIYCQEPKELQQVMRFATQYSPALVFCEDVDRIAGREREDDVNHLINTLDGIDTKTHEIITVLTTNEVEKVNQALLRPGRLDAVISIQKPDAEAVQRLIRLYAGRLIPASADLTQVGEILQGNIPAIIREVVERSKLAALSFVDSEEDITEIPQQALIVSANTMDKQLQLLKGKPPVLTSEQKAHEGVAAASAALVEWLQLNRPTELAKTATTKN